MSDMIRDGTGKGYLVKVNEDNHLLTKCVVVTHIEHHSSQDATSFTANWALTQISGGATENLGYITYNGDSKLTISKVILCSEEPGTGLTKFGLWSNPSAVSGGAVRTPVNLNLGSSLTSDTTVQHDNDGTAVTITGGGSVGTVRLSGSNTFEWNLDNALVLQKGDTFAIKANATTTGSKTRATLYWFEHGEED